MIRSELSELVNLGAFASSKDVDLALIKRQQELIHRITPPISDAEARELIKLFGPDDYYGLAWTILHLIENAPGWPLADCLTGPLNEWRDRLKDRVANKSTQK